MGGRAGGSGTGFGSRSGGIGRQVGPNIIDNPKAISTSDLIKMSESGGLASGLATKELNSRLEVVKANNMVFRNPDGKLVAPKGHLVKVGNEGYFGFGDGVFNNTKKSTAQAIVGHVVKFQSSHIYKPVGKISEGGEFIPNK